jgi:hypothetical protein
MSEQPTTAKILLFTGVRRDPVTGRDPQAASGSAKVFALKSAAAGKSKAIEALIDAAVLAGKVRRFPAGHRALPLTCGAISGMAAAIAGPAGDLRPAVLNFSSGHSPSGLRVLPVGINEEDGA